MPGELLRRAVTLERVEEEQCIQPGLPRSAVKERDNALIWVSKRRISEQEGAAVLPPPAALSRPPLRSGLGVFLRGGVQLPFSKMPFSYTQVF